MRKRRLGRTGFEVSEISFGCGGTAGLMVRGSEQEQCAVLGNALEQGINIFDTSPTYGGGHSEVNLGKTLKTLGASPKSGAMRRINSKQSVHDILFTNFSLVFRRMSE